MRLTGKVSLGKDIRRIPIYDTDYEEFKHTCYDLFKLNDEYQFVLCYINSQNQKIEIGDEHDWNQLKMDHLEADLKVIRIYVERCEEKEVLISPFLKNFFCHEKNERWHLLIQNGMDLLGSASIENWETAKVLFHEAASLQPFHPVPLFYTACVESMLGNAQVSLQYLENSISNGFENMEKLYDKCFDNIKHIPEFRNILNRIEKREEKKETSPREMTRLRKWTVLECQAQQFLSENNYQSARETYLEQLILFPEFPGPYFNLACLESLSNNMGLALDYLENAEKCGFKDTDALNNEPMLKNIRRSGRFKKIMDSITKI